MHTYYKKKYYFSFISLLYIISRPRVSCISFMIWHYIFIRSVWKTDNSLENISRIIYKIGHNEQKVFQQSLVHIYLNFEEKFVIRTKVNNTKKRNNNFKTGILKKTCVLFPHRTVHITDITVYVQNYKSCELNCLCCKHNFEDQN